MNNVDPEKYVEAGQALVQLGRTLQRTFPPPNVVGCQFDEQDVIDQLLPGTNGIYVDCGANDGVDCSNTLRLYQRGWRGLLIEPLPDVWPSLMLNRPGDFFCPIAASDADGFATLHACRSVSSLDKCWRRDNEATMPIRVERLATILKRYPSIDWSKTDFLSVDVEGHEGAVFNGIDWDTFKPKVILAEWAAQDGSDQSGPWHRFLESKGYQNVHENKLNRIYRRA